jgi:hypothetical protein
MGLTGKIERREKSKPVIILDWRGTLNEGAANLYLYSKKATAMKY